MRPLLGSRALIVNLNDLQVCEAVRCLLSRAERVDPQEPKDKIYFLDLLTVPQVASTLHKSEEWVRRHKRELGVITLGGCGRGADLLFARAAINTYVVRHAAPELKRLVRCEGARHGFRPSAPWTRGLVHQVLRPAWSPAQGIVG